MKSWLAKRDAPRERTWFWATLTLSSISIIALVFALWEVVENRLFSHVDYVTLHYLYITRGIFTSLLLAFWAAWYVLRERRHSEEALRRSNERYRGLLEVSPGAVALYDSNLHTTEWNATAERLYGWRRDEVLGSMLPTVPSDKQDELRNLIERVAAGAAVPGIETVRLARTGERIPVQLTLLRYQQYFLEVTEDIRERVRMRDQMLEIEKLASMGKMAAGTAHHLNTPLAALLLRVQMMRESNGSGVHETDLARLEEGLHFCQQFVRRLLDFSRRPPAQRQPENAAQTLRSVVSFLQPALQSKNALVSVELTGIERDLVLADRNLLEVLFSTLLSNALDAIPERGHIRISGAAPRSGAIEIQIADNGCGIRAEDQRFVFEPFFTTKGPGKGTGLGLAIAQNIVFEHGGSISLESRPGEGTTVSVELPIARRGAAA